MVALNIQSFTEEAIEVLEEAAKKYKLNPDAFEFEFKAACVALLKLNLPAAGMAICVGMILIEEAAEN